MRAQILSIGDELLGGYITDTNATWLEQQLALINIPVEQVTHIGDNLARLTDAIRTASDSAQIVICTGGVGPTDDDLTREAIAAVMGETPVLDSDLLTAIRAFFAARGLEMPERNGKQAWVIPSSETLANPIGTAPGWFVRRGDHVIAAMPGVPREMFRMYTEQLAPRLEQMQPGRVVRAATLKTIGIGESMVEQNLHALILRGDPVIATYAKDDGVHIRVTAEAESVDIAESRRESAIEEIRGIIGPYIYGRDDQTLAGVLIASLRSAGLKLAIADHGGGGRFASLLAAETDAPDVVIGSWLGFGPVEISASSVAQRVIEETGADIALSILGNEELDGPGVYKAVIEIAVHGARTGGRTFPIRSGHEDVQRRSALFAAEVLREALGG